VQIAAQIAQRIADPVPVVGCELRLRVCHGPILPCLLACAGTLKGSLLHRDVADP
jgi:hypothetical protein